MFAYEKPRTYYPAVGARDNRVIGKTQRTKQLTVSQAPRNGNYQIR